MAKQAGRTRKKISVKVIGSDARTAYVALPGHAVKRGTVAKTVDLDSVVAGYSGPRVLLDFNESGRLIGIEILA